ncbi:unnamed protein product [Amoebophrya sp. A25]|nr:unnamed protein product [Amoebophrya sp. A25]|eukprot:GSA25T00005921001.1
MTLTSSATASEWPPREPTTCSASAFPSSQRAAFRKIDGEFDVQHWLDILGPDITFPTEIAELTRLEAETLLAACVAREELLDEINRAGLDQLRTRGNGDHQGNQQDEQPHQDDDDLLFTETGVVEYIDLLERYAGNCEELLESGDLDAHRRQMSSQDALLSDASKKAIFSALQDRPSLRNALQSPELGQISRRIDEAMRRLSSSASTELKSASFFLRLSTRSPKDAACVSEVDYLEEYVRQKQIQTHHKSEATSTRLTWSEKMDLLCLLSLRAMRVSNGVEALSLLLTSKRVRDDLKQALEDASSTCRSTPGSSGAAGTATPSAGSSAEADAEKTNNSKVEFDLSLVVREWNDGIRPATEFRGFVDSEGHLVALSQYNEICHYPHLFQERNGHGDGDAAPHAHAGSGTKTNMKKRNNLINVIQNVLIDFVKTELKPRLVGTSLLPCIVDFHVEDGIEEDEGFQLEMEEDFDDLKKKMNYLKKVKVVELNPANERTSFSLFEPDAAKVLEWLRIERQIHSENDDDLQSAEKKKKNFFHEFRLVSRQDTREDVAADSDSVRESLGRVLQGKISEAHARWKMKKIIEHSGVIQPTQFCDEVC